MHVMLRSEKIGGGKCRTFFYLSLGQHLGQVYAILCFMAHTKYTKNKVI